MVISSSIFVIRSFNSSVANENWFLRYQSFAHTVSIVSMVSNNHQTIHFNSSSEEISPLFNSFSKRRRWYLILRIFLIRISIYSVLIWWATHPPYAQTDWAFIYNAEIRALHVSLILSIKLDSFSFDRIEFDDSMIWIRNE